MPRTFEVSHQKEVSCAMRSDLDATRRLGELKSEFIESPPICISNISYERTNELTHIAEMNQVAPDGIKWGVSKIFSLLSVQGKLSYEQRLRLKDDGRPCPSVTIKHRTSAGVYDSYSWICGDTARNTYFCWPCLVMGDLSKVRFFVCLLF